MGVVNVSCQLAPTQTLKKGVKTFWVQSVADRFESVNHINGVSLNLLVRPLNQAPSFRFPNCIDLRRNQQLKGHALCSQWLFTIYLGELVGSRFVRIHYIFNLVPEQRLPLYKQFHLPKKWPRRPETSIKDGFEENGTRISVWNIPSGKKKEDYLLQEFHCSRKFSTGMTQKVVFHLLSNRIFRNLFVNGKPPISLVIFRTYHEKKTIFETGPRSSVSYAKSYRA